MSAVSSRVSRARAGARGEAWPYIVILGGFAIGSSGPLLIREALDAGMSSPAIVAGRQIISCLVLTPFVLGRHRHELARLSPRNLLFALLAGIVLAVRFYFQFEAFNNTSVLITGVLGSSGPLWVALTEALLLRAVFNRHIQAGVLLALGGGIIVAVAGLDGGTSLGNNALLGAFHALTAAFLSAFYLSFGRLARGQISFWPWLWLIFTIAAVVSLIGAAIGGVPLTGYSSRAILALLALTLTAQLVGHGAMNYVLAYVSATFVSISAQLATVLSTVGAWVLLGEKPGLAQFVGSAIIICGVILATLGRPTQASR